LVLRSKIPNLLQTCPELCFHENLISTTIRKICIKIIFNWAAELKIYLQIYKGDGKKGIKSHKMYLTSNPGHSSKTTSVIKKTISNEQTDWQ